MSFKYKLVDSNLLYTDITDEKFKNIKEKIDYQMWKNDFTLIQILVISEEADVIELEVEQIKDFEFEIYNFKKNLAYTGKPFEPIELYTKENRTIATDLLLKENKIKLSRGDTNSFIISVKTNKEISPTKHQIHFKLNSLNNRNEKFENKFTIEVKDKKVEKLQNFDLQLWQYPYSVSEYYGLKPFSEEHIDILKNHLSIYKKLGADAIVASICEDAWDGQTYSKNAIHYPSMIKWSMNNGKMNYSYEDFDKWIKLNEEIGLGKEKIILYGMAPWHFSFTYYQDDKLIKEKFDYNSETYKLRWIDFLEDLYKHLDELNIFNRVYVGIDERGFGEEIFDILSEASEKFGKRLKIAASIDNFKENGKYAEKIDYVSVSFIEYDKDRNAYFEFANQRRKKGKMTTLYSCTGHKPGNFVLSQPGETYYTLINSAISDGFLRWAYDAWVKNPLYDTTHEFFEPGDCFLVYPNDKTKISDISIRLLKIKEALYDISKLKSMYSREELFEIFEKMNVKFIWQKEYLSSEKINELEEDIAKISSLFNGESL